MPLIFLRSLIYNVLFYLLLVCWLIAAGPTFLMPRTGIMKIARLWARSSIWLLRVASKHQSMWETFALLQFFDQPLYILKRELTLIPFFGWYLIKAGMVAVDRRAGGRALLKMVRQASEAVRRGRQLIILPEGTRRPVGAPPQYKPGVAQLYASCRVNC